MHGNPRAHQQSRGTDYQACSYQQAHKKYLPGCGAEQAPHARHDAGLRTAQRKHRQISPVTSNQVALVISAGDF